jgi:hypothetical protein
MQELSSNLQCKNGSSRLSRWPLRQYWVRLRKGVVQEVSCPGVAVATPGSVWGPSPKKPRTEPALLPGWAAREQGRRRWWLRR